MMTKPRLIDPAEAPEVTGLAVPRQFYWVLNEPAPLAGMQLPRESFPWEWLEFEGFRWVVCLCAEKPKYDPSPLKPLVTVELCDLDERDLPEDPEQEERVIRAIASKVMEKLRQGEGVIVHCAAGRGRTGTVLGVVLKMLGLQDEEVFTFLNRMHQLRKTEGWPESPWQAEVVRRANAVA
jgi:hypothetical protein